MFLRRAENGSAPGFVGRRITISGIDKKKKHPAGNRAGCFVIKKNEA
jgi:hypothetical protein